MNFLNQIMNKYEDEIDEEIPFYLFYLMIMFSIEIINQILKKKIHQ